MKDFQLLLFRKAILVAVIKELKRARTHCPDCGWLDYRIKDKERELKLINQELEKLKER